MRLFFTLVVFSLDLLKILLLLRYEAEEHEHLAVLGVVARDEVLYRRGEAFHALGLSGERTRLSLGGLDHLHADTVGEPEEPSQYQKTEHEARPPLDGALYEPLLHYCVAFADGCCTALPSAVVRACVAACAATVLMTLASAACGSGTAASTAGTFATTPTGAEA